MVALDFVALLLSKDQPVQASLSISEGLRQIVSLGTLGADRVKDSRLTTPRKADNATIGRGWKIQAFDHSVDSILAAATRLETEIDVETKYWEEILAVDQKGWKTCKLPQERHTLGVRFGFFEAAPAFRNRSLAALRRNSNGTVYLDQGVADATPKRVMIRVETDGAITGQLAPEHPVSDDAPLESLILLARNTIFEEELWQELNREARTLANHHVRWASGAITVQLSPSTRILLSLIPLSPSPPNPDPAPLAHTHDDTAELISLSLHLLLLHAHRQTLRRRSQPPPPLSHQPRPTPPYPLLRPLLTRLHHESVISTLLRTATSLHTTLRTAALPLPPPTLTTSNHPPPPSPRPGPPQSAAEATIDSLISHLEAELLIPLTAAPLPRQRATVRLRTEMSLQTRFQVAVEGALARVARPPPNPGAVGEVAQFVLWAAGCALAAGFADAAGRDGDGAGTGTAAVEGDGESEAGEGLRGWEGTAVPGVLRKSDGGRRVVKEVGFSVSEEAGGEGVRVAVRIRDGVGRGGGASEVVWDGRGRVRGGV